MHRFFVDGAGIGAATIEITNPEDVGHIGRVLRLRTGDRVLLCDGNGWEYTCVLEEIGSRSVTARIEDKQKNGTEPAVRVTLYQGVPKGGKLDTVVQKCVELGVCEIVPVFMERSVIADKGRFEKKADRLRTIAESAAKQCGRGIIPAVEGAISFAQMQERLAQTPLILFPYENEDGLTMKGALREEGASEAGEIAVVIGPEGGFSDGEAAALKAIPQCRCVSLGKRILRTETAGMAALAMLLYELEL